MHRPVQHASTIFINTLNSHVYCHKDALYNQFQNLKYLGRTQEALLDTKSERYVFADGRAASIAEYKIGKINFRALATDF